MLLEKKVRAAASCLVQHKHINCNLPERCANAS
jgi:hypothetical protein